MNIKNTILSISLLMVFSININAGQHTMPQPSAPQYEQYEQIEGFPQAPGGPGSHTIPVVQATPIEGQSKNKETDLLSKCLTNILHIIRNNPKISFSLGILTSGGLYAYKNSPSFKKDVDEKYAKAKHYFKNDLTVDKVVGGLAVAGLIYAIGYIVYQDIKKIESKKRTA